MPFRSASQRKWMYANKPEMAKRWQKHTPKDKKLPEKASHALGLMLGKQAAEEPSVGVALMAYPDKASLERINRFRDSLDQGSMHKLTDGGTDGPHVTIRYWRSNGPVSKRVKNFINKYLGNGKAVTAKATGWKILGGDTLALTLEGSRIMELQKEIDDGLQERGIDPSTYPDYIPHVSLFEKATTTPDKKPDIKIRFNRWVLSARVAEDMGKSAAYNIGLEFGKQAKIDCEKDPNHADCKERKRRYIHHGSDRFPEIPENGNGSGSSVAINGGNGGGNSNGGM